ncbi:hypothetical protein ABW19_dt0207567 [Dactylella cylindrospora]|nr:hypothetical protein ABW19_dt0207567 [Dactylella cylindrospora]
MGASQSSQDHNQSGHQTDREMKQDFYSLLGVDQTADQDEIKKAYRRKALELHPDKNVNDVETATRLFSEIQAAYEVLSDPQERAWYDSHRDQILREDDEDEIGEAAARAENVTVTTAELLKQFSLFSSRMDMQDSNPQGFYATAGKIFERIAIEEEKAAERANLDYIAYPSFGNSKSSYEEDVKAFYINWSSFATLKSFAWEDKYRYKDAPDRRVKRLMEKENRKLREAAIREFNDTVKHFVLYIRKRDPRYLPNFQTDEERDAAAREGSKDQSRRARLENAAKMANYTETEWTKTEDNWRHDESEATEDEEPHVEFECVVCNKTFKTEKQVEMHEKSKKHIKAVQTLKRQMKKEGKELGLDEGMPSQSNTQLEGDVSDPETDEEISPNEPAGIPPTSQESQVLPAEDDSDGSLAENLGTTSLKDTEELTRGDDVETKSDLEEPASSQTRKAKKARRKQKQAKTQTEV